jgi:hypothetical protein
MQGDPKLSTDPAAADPVSAAVLKEYGFSDSALATYKRDDGRTLTVRAARFAGADGAFGAYTFYLRPQMTADTAKKKEDRIGDQAAFLGQRVLFYAGNILVDAQFSQESAMSGSQMRVLARALPRPNGNAANLPPFIEFMPHQDYVANTQKYVMGPEALAALGTPVSADLVDFNVSSEVTLGHYSMRSGEATLMLISYPTPKLAADHLRRIDAARQAAQQGGAENPENAGAFVDKRTGPIIAMVSGGVSDSDAKSLLGKVNYEANVTWSQPTDNPQARDLYSLLLNTVVLCGILAGLAVVAGVAFGGIRILMKRWYPDKVFDRPEQMEFISLRLRETVVITETIVPDAGRSEADGGRRAPRNPA